MEQELEKEILEYLAMIDLPNRKALGNPNSVADSADHNDQQEPIREYTQSFGEMTHIKGGCAFVTEANPQKQRNLQEETEETTSDDVSHRKGKAKGTENGKGNGRTCCSCGEQRHIAR